MKPRVNVREKKRYFCQEFKYSNSLILPKNKIIQNMALLYILYYFDEIITAGVILNSLKKNCCSLGPRREPKLKYRDIHIIFIIYFILRIPALEV